MIERATLTPVTGGPSLTEADLEGHLANATGGAENGSTERARTSTGNLKEQDYQLFEALNLLRGIALSRGPAGGQG